MRNPWNRGAIAVMAILLVLFLVTAGCTTIPGPEPRTTPAPTKTTVPVTPQVRDPGAKLQTPQITPVAVATRTLSVVTATSTTPAGAYESRTCAVQGGTIAGPGQQCPGAWLAAPDTFNCCPVPPVRDPVLNASVTIGPFDIAIPLDDDPGSVLP